MTKDKSLLECPECKEMSVKVKTYKRLDGSKGRVGFCYNHGCGYRKYMPFPEEILAGLKNDKGRSE